MHGLADVFAAGDITSFPVKQGGIATQQIETIHTRVETLGSLLLQVLESLRHANGAPAATIYRTGCFCNPGAGEVAFTGSTCRRR